MIKNIAFHEFLEFPWKKSYMHLMRPSVMENLINNSELIFSNELPGFLKRNWEHISGNTLVDPFRMGTIIDLFVQSKDYLGDIIEFGSYKGGTGILLALLVKHFNLPKKVHLFDSFSGLPDPNNELDKGYRKGQFKSDYDKLKAIVSNLSLQDTIVLHKGWFSESLSPFLEKENDFKACLMHIDCDLYDSTKDCFPSVYPYVVDGGVIIYDDFNDGGRGEKTAVLEDLEPSEEIYIGPAPQAFSIKSKPSNNEDNQFKDGDFKYNFDKILANNDYLGWMNNELGLNYKKEFLRLKSEHNE